MSEKLISIIIPTHNRAELLKRAIRSVLGQTYKNLEIIVIDDASDCNNLVIINNFSFPIIYYRFETNQGGNVCRNKGVNLASGEYVAFLDDDDTWSVTKLEKQYTSIIKNNIDLTYTGKNIITINKKLTKRYSFSNPSSANLQKSIMLKNFIGTTSSIMLKKDSFLLIGGFDIDMPALQDYEFYIRFIKNGFTVMGIDDALVNYFIYESGVSVSKDIKKIFSASKIMIHKNKHQKYIWYLAFSLSKNVFKTIIFGHK